MKFLNRFVMAFTAFVSLWTVLFYFGLLHFINTQQGWYILLISILYGLMMFLTGRFCGRRDPYDGYMGFNYHLMTFIVCISAAWIVQVFFNHKGAALTTTFAWGIGLLVHLYVVTRKRKTRMAGFDKAELFE